MKALILAGGLGTRLKAVVSDRPKPLAEAGGKPFLQHQIEWLCSQGFDDLVFCVGHRAGQVQDYFGNGCNCGVHIAYSVEQELLGTAGAIKNAQALLKDTFLVLNGDSYLDLDLNTMIAVHRHRQGHSRTIGTLAAVRLKDTSACGGLQLDDENRIVSFREKDLSGPGWINAGVYVLEPEILALIPSGCCVSIERETFPCALARGYELYAHPMNCFFVDIGTPVGYRRFQEYVGE